MQASNLTSGSTPLLTGLTAAEVVERRGRGEGNNVKLPNSRSFKDILVTNILNPVNLVLYAIGLGFILIGEFKNVIATLGLVIFNAGVSIFQEVRAKRRLDQIALLSQAKTTVLRDGQEQQVDPSELVRGDILVIRAGDQIPVDGVVAADRAVAGGRIEVDESALTGESDPITRQAGEKVLSGSFCLTGQALIEAQGVGEQSFANQIARNARRFKLALTPLQFSVNRLLRVLMLGVLFLTFLSVLSLFVLKLPFDVWVNVVAVITGSISAGLLTLITLNYSWGAVRVGERGGLVQQINAIEALSNVTVVCSDKTGTLTSNQIRFHDLYAAGIDRHDLECRLGGFAHSATSTNKTTEAILDHLPGTAYPLADEVPFSSARKWSALAVAPGAAPDLPPGAYVLGAVEMLAGSLELDDAARQQVDDWAGQGLRVLAFACGSGVASLHDAAGQPALPDLELLGLVSFSDELRPGLHETLAALGSHGVRLKVISGDSPQTVAALARQAGLPGDLRAVSGPDLAGMSAGEFAQAAAEATVFGRITPDQKEQLVTALRDQGEFVAMIGDGVNDVLSLKQANIGIAMESGSTAARSVAAMILLKDSFDALPPALDEGQRIVNSITNILKMYMASVFALLLLVLGLAGLNLGFPVTTLQSTLLSFFARGLPPLLLGLAATSAWRRDSIGKSMVHFTLPASVLLFLFGLFVYMGVFYIVQHGLTEIDLTPETTTAIEHTMGLELKNLSAGQTTRTVSIAFAQTALTLFFMLTGVLLMTFVVPPTKWWAGGASYTGGNRIINVATILLLLASVVLLAVPFVRHFFELAPLPLGMVVAVVVTALIWVLVQRAAWRGSWFEKFLMLEPPAVP
jgi:cation-transporting P-type ATPase E